LLVEGESQWECGTPSFWQLAIPALLHMHLSQRFTNPNDLNSFLIKYVEHCMV